MLAHAIEEFKDSVVPNKTRIEALPEIVLLFGGELSLDKRHASCRNVFLTWAHESSHPVARLLRAPEDYPEWNNVKGYGNLVDFEIDAGCLSQGIILFSEGPGAFAELGAFSTDDVLCERMFVVIARKHYDDPSFIANGPVKRIEGIRRSDGICLVENIEPASFESQAAEIAEALQEKIASRPQTNSFDPQRVRDQFLLVADLVELFGALAEDEIVALMLHMGVDVSEQRFLQIINQLELFELIMPARYLNKRFWTHSKGARKHYLSYTSHEPKKAFDRSRFKLRSYNLLKSDESRNRAYGKAHG